jgi:hypothetical protein
MRKFVLMVVFMFGMVVNALAGASGNPMAVPPEPVKPEIAAAKIADCGFSDVRPTFDETLQEDVVDVRGVSSESEEQLRCVALTSLETGYYVVFPPSVEEIYEQLYWNLSRERRKADASAWLEKRGLLARLPTYDPKRSDDTEIARAIERLCGPKAAGTLQPMEGMATFSEALALGDMGEETFLCLINAAEVSGYPLVFVSNEVSRQEP